MADPKKDSRMQVRQDQANKNRRPGEDSKIDGNFDKKLDGPNRPST